MIIMKLNGDMLKDARDRKGLTQGQVAEALGMSIATVSYAESGYEIRNSSGVKLCDFLNIDLAEAVVPRVPATSSGADEGSGDAA